MLNNEKVFNELMNGLQSINPEFPLPATLRAKLWNGMEVEPVSNAVEVLEVEGEKPKKAYFVLSGFVMVYGYDERTDEYVWRIYRAGSIVALNCFMHRKKSIYTIKSAKKAVLWSVSAALMQELYEDKDMPGMREFALQTCSEYDNRKERARNILLALEQDDRVLKFYKYYPGLLPAVKSTVPDIAVASFLALTKSQLRRTRTKLIKDGFLKIIC